jgi:hypothetical protein
VWAAIGEEGSGSDDEVFDSSRDEDLVGFGFSEDALDDVDRHAADVLAANLPAERD